MTRYSGRSQRNPDSLSCGTSGAHELDDLVDRHAVDRSQRRPVRSVRPELADDVDAVGEVVEPQRVDVQAVVRAGRSG